MIRYDCKSSKGVSLKKYKPQHLITYKREIDMLRCIIRYYGGKNGLAPIIIDEICRIAKEYQCDRLAELCGGGARVLLNVPDAIFKGKLYNDYSVGLCRLFECVKEEKMCKVLISVLKKMPYNKEMFKYAKENMNNTNLDILSSAVYTYIAVMQSWNANMKDFKMSYAEEKNSEDREEAVETYYKQIDRIAGCTDTLQNTKIVNERMEKVLTGIKHMKNAIVYLDPSYHKGAIKVYPYEMTREDHKKMVQLLLKVEAVVVLSGYDPAQYGCDDYKPLEEAGWRKVSLGKVHLSSSGKDTQKEEFLWINRK
ncbi:MAG TPA: hypothetical protein DCP90_03170 [Clostridiales bacterium]|nr:MAG: hypothetical protein A2Y22_05965 [Clostridiales bacterium GWD2_32_59]HAN09596.1 hypothetical protein [Clostridiales bacterium]